ncbi:hypothetical protein JOH51_006612 [Rhizobium leguminosarum]|nr:hypothetical protein [Rhizobium leguminosarum]
METVEISNRSDFALWKRLLDLLARPSELQVMAATLASGGFGHEPGLGYRGGRQRR